MSDDPDHVHVDPEFARSWERDQPRREVALNEFRGSLPAFEATADPIDAFVATHEQWFQELEHASRTAHALGQKHGCEIPRSAIQDVLKLHFVEASRQIEPRVYERARHYDQLDRWVTEVEDIQALISEYDRAERFDLLQERGDRFNQILHARIALEKRIPEELKRLRRLGASIPPVRSEPRITSSLRARLIKALTGRPIHPVLLAKELGIDTDRLRSLISRLNKPDKFILNLRNEAYYLRDHPPACREDLPRT